MPELKFNPNHVLLFCSFVSHLTLDLSGFCEPFNVDGMKVSTQQFHQTSFAGAPSSLGWG